MPHVDITVTSMGFNVGVSKVGEILGSSSLGIHPYSRKFEQWKYDQTNKRWILQNEFYHHDDVRKVCYFPRYDLDNFLSFLTDNHTEYEVYYKPPVEGLEISFEMLPFVTYKNDKQKRAIEFLTDDSKGPLRALALQTGVGKTAAAIWALQRLKRRSMITMTSRLEQWLTEAQKYTTLDEDDLYLVQGLPSLEKLFNQIDKQIKPKIILMSTKTMQLYLDYGPSYQHLPHPSEMCEVLQIGISLNDEGHEWFKTNYVIGIVLNPSLFIPITATFVANDPFVKNIFKQFYPDELQFTGGDYDKFVNVTSYMYKGGGGFIKPFNYTARSVYSQVAFENFLLGRGGRILEGMVQDAIIPIIKNHYINLADKGEKFLLLCATQKMCEYFVSLFKKTFKSKTVSAFYSGMPSTILDRFDMIVSTPGSAGTGRDIKGLRTCLVFDNTASEIRALQYLGRLRGPPQMLNVPEFVTIGMSCIPQHQRYSEKRSFIYANRALKLTHREI